MNSIVSIVDGQSVTTSLAIAEGVGNSHKTVIQLIRQNTSDLEEFGPLAFEMRNSTSGAGRPTEVALLNEQQSTLIMTYMRNNDIVREFKKRLVKAFYELAQSRAIPSDLSRLEILQLAMDAEKQKLALKDEVESLKPKALFHDRVVKSEDAISVAEAAKIIGTGQRRLFAYLRQIGWISRRNEPYQTKIESGYLDVKLGNFNHPDHGLKQSVTALVTGKGLAKLQKIWCESHQELSA